MGRPQSAVRGWLTVAAVIAVLVAVNVGNHWIHSVVHDLVVPIAAVALVVICWVSGMTVAELGLSRSQMGSGLRLGAAIALLILVVVVIVAIVPWTRSFMLNDRYKDVSSALLSAFVIIPLQTAIPEELIFRGVLFAALRRVLSVRGVVIVDSLLFGMWHVVSSLGLTAGNSGLSGALGSGVFAQMIGIVGAVIATAFAGLVFCWLRLRSDSVLAPIMVHWSLNASGALASALAWRFGG